MQSAVLIYFCKLQTYSFHSEHPPERAPLAHCNSATLTEIDRPSSKKSAPPTTASPSHSAVLCTFADSQGTATPCSNPSLLSFSFRAREDGRNTVPLLMPRSAKRMGSLLSSSNREKKKKKEDKRKGERRARSSQHTTEHAYGTHMV